MTQDAGRAPLRGRGAHWRRAMSIRRDRALALYGRACGWKGKGDLVVCRVNRIGESRVPLGQCVRKRGFWWEGSTVGFVQRAIASRWVINCCRWRAGSVHPGIITAVRPARVFLIVVGDLKRSRCTGPLGRNVRAFGKAW